MQVYCVVKCTNTFCVLQLNPSAESQIPFFLCIFFFFHVDNHIYFYCEDLYQSKKRTMNLWTDKAGGLGFFHFCFCFCFPDFLF